MRIALSETPYKCWWHLSLEEAHSYINQEVERIETDNLDLYHQMMQAAALYGDRSAWPGLWSIGRSLPLSQRLSHNVIATASDALVAEVTQSLPRPMAVTVGGDYEQRLRAKSMTQYWDAKFEEERVHDLARQAVRDSILFRVGIIRPYLESSQVRVERILPPQLLVDDRGVVDVYPRTYYLKRVVDKEYLKELYKDDERALGIIARSKRPERKLWHLFNDNNQDNVIELVEAYHLRSGKNGTDGMMAVVLSDGCLEMKPYNREKPPFCFVRAVPPLNGFYGESLVMRAAPAQMEMNKLLFRVQQSMHLHAVPRVFINRAAGIIKSHMQNDVGVIIEYEGQPPVFLTPQSMGADVYQHIERLEQWVYKEMGVSELSATSKKPAGLDSGAALRVYNDVQSRRWINLQRSYEDLIVDIAKELTFLEKQASTNVVPIKSKRGLEQVKWADIDLEEDKYVVRVFAASALPNTPAGKLQALEEMVKTGVIDTKTFIKLADVPDLESVRNLAVAPEELLEKRFDAMLRTGKYVAPEPYMDLQQGRIIASLMVQEAELEGAPEDRLELLRRWIGDSLELDKRIEMFGQMEMMEQQAEMAAMAPPPPPMAPGMPPGMPAPPMAPGGVPLPTQAPVPPPQFMPTGP